MHTSYIGIGTNLGDKLKNLQSAIDYISEHSTILEISSIYQTEAMGFESEDDFFNIVVKIQTFLKPNELLIQNQGIEKKLGRKYYNDGLYHSRIIDLDILLYNTEIIKTENLNIPHPHIQERNFVLIPLLEITPEISVPNDPKMTYKNHLTEAMENAIKKIETKLLIPH